MPSTLAGQLTIVSLTLGILVILFRAKRGYDRDKTEQARKLAAKDAEDKQHREWLEELWLEYCRHTGVRVSDELIRRHMRINGNARRSSEENDRIYGKDRPRGDSSGGDVDLEKVKGAGRE